jgi:hypothetical protein
MVVYNSSPVVGGWRTFARNNHASSQVLHVYAICLHNTPGSSSFEFNQVNVPAGDSATANVTCPAGSIVTGGGFVSDSNRHWVFATLKSGNAWQARARNISGFDQPLTVYAVCLSGVNASTFQIFSQPTIPGNSSSGGEAPCLANRLVTAGGYYLSNDVEAYNSSMKASDVSKWNAFFRNSSAAPRLINVYATCLSFQ